MAAILFFTEKIPLMLKLNLLHPDILQALGSNGHGAKILIADGNFPVSTETAATCKKVFLNLAPGMLSVTDILGVIKEFIPVEKYMIMVAPDDSEHPIHREFARLLGENTTCQKLKREAFYQEASTDDVCLAIASAETRRFGNILLVIG